MTRKKILLSTIIFFSIVAVCLIMATIFDLEISKTLCVVSTNEYFSQNFFVAFFEIFGESIMYIILASCFAIIFNFFYKKTCTKKVLKIFILTTLFVLGTISVFLLFNFTLKNAINHATDNFKTFTSYFQTKVLFIVLSFAINYLFLYVFSKLSQETLKALTKWAIITIVVLAFSTLLVQILKHIMHRTRFRTMLYIGDLDFSYYTNWYQINHNTFDSILSFGGDFFKSFPSGHASATASIFSLCLLPLSLQKFNTKNWKIFFLSISIVLTILVCISRIMAGAHFLTDVFVGAFLTIIPVFVFVIFQNLFNDIMSKLDLLIKCV